MIQERGKSRWNKALEGRDTVGSDLYVKRLAALPGFSHSFSDTAIKVLSKWH